jgi:riboflavin synthase
MFTGIIETTGKVRSFTPKEGAARLVVDAPGIADKVRKGDSVAVSGVCLTALEMGPDWFAADVAAETISRTTLSRLQPGSVVNLELPTPAGAPLGGHVVQGHIDGVGKLVALDPVAGTAAEDSDWVLRIRVPQTLLRYVVEKGSIAVEGISLTVAGIDANEIWIAILPHTYKATNLHTLKPGMEVNLEVDVLGKYAESRSRAEATKKDLTVDYLLANGY